MVNLFGGSKNLATTALAATTAAFVARTGANCGARKIYGTISPLNEVVPSTQSAGFAAAVKAGATAVVADTN